MRTDITIENEEGIKFFDKDVSREELDALMEMVRNFKNYKEEE